MKKVILLSASMLLLSASAFASGAVSSSSSLSEAAIEAKFAAWGFNYHINLAGMQSIYNLKYANQAIQFYGVNGDVTMILSTSNCAQGSTVALPTTTPAAVPVALTCTLSTSKSAQ